MSVPTSRKEAETAVVPPRSGPRIIGRHLESDSPPGHKVRRRGFHKQGRLPEAKNRGFHSTSGQGKGPSNSDTGQPAAAGIELAGTEMWRKWRILNMNLQRNNFKDSDTGKDRQPQVIRGR